MKVMVSYEHPWVNVTKVRKETVSVNQGTLSALLHQLEQTYGPTFGQIVFDPASGEIRPEIAVLVDGRRGELESQLKDGSEVAFLLPFAGG